MKKLEGSPGIDRALIVRLAPRSDVAPMAEGGTEPFAPGGDERLDGLQRGTEIRVEHRPPPQLVVEQRHQTGLHPLGDGEQGYGCSGHANRLRALSVAAH